MQFVDGIKPLVPVGRVLDLRQSNTEAVIHAAQGPAEIQVSAVRWHLLMAIPVMIIVVSAIRFSSVVRPAKATTARASLAAAVQPAPKPIVPATANLDTQLQKILADFAASQPVPVAIVAKDLKTGKYATLNDNNVFVSASLYKLFVANQILHQRDYGGLSLSAPAGGGTNRSVESCLEVMINVSDNPCGKALGTLLGWDKQNAALASQGFTNTDLSIPYPKTSAGDVAKLLEQLYTTEFLKPFSDNLFLRFLKDQRVRNRLPAGLPTSTEIAHKTGDLEGNMHDAGIVYGPKTDYMIVMLSGPWPTPSHSFAAFKDLSGKIYTYFNL